MTLRAQGAPPILSSTGTTLETSTSRSEIYSSTAKYVFRSIYPDPSPAGNRDHRASGGTFQSKELGVVYAKDLSEASILDDGWEPNSIDTNKGTVDGPREEEKTKEGEDVMDTNEMPIERPPKDSSPPAEKTTTNLGDVRNGNASGPRESRTLADLRFHPGDYITITVVFPKGDSGPPPSAGGAGASGGFGASGLNIRGSAGGRVGDSRGDTGPPRQIPWVTGTSAAGPSAHSRTGGFSSGSGWRGRGGGGPPGRGDRDRERERDIPPPRDGRTREYGARGRGAGGRGARSRSRDRSMGSSRSRSKRRSPPRSKSRSRSPPRRRRGD